VSGYQKGKTNLDFTEARDSEWQWHQLGHMQICTSLQTDSRASTPPLKCFTGRMPFLPPNQQHQSTEGRTMVIIALYKSTFTIQYHTTPQHDAGLLLGPNLFHGGKCQIVRRFLAKKMPDFTEISRKAICCSLNPQNHLYSLIHKAYLRYLKAVNVKMSPMVILLFIDMLTAYQVARSHVQSRASR